MDLIEALTEAKKQAAEHRDDRFVVQVTTMTWKVQSRRPGKTATTDYISVLGPDSTSDAVNYTIHER